MSERFDEISRAMAGSHSRRGVLKILGGAAAAAAAATVLKPFRAEAATCSGPTNAPCKAGTTPCGPCCCKAGIACQNRSTGTCACPSGQAHCGDKCCSGTCSDAASGCCCPSGTTPCGTSCCKAGVACLSASKGICGCPSGTTSCLSSRGLLCCPSGKACGDSACAPAPTTAVSVCPCSESNPCPSGQCCSSGTCVSSCPGGQVCFDGICVDATSGCCRCAGFCIGGVPAELCGFFDEICLLEYGEETTFTPGDCDCENCFCGP